MDGTGLGSQSLGDLSSFRADEDLGSRYHVSPIPVPVNLCLPQVLVLFSDGRSSPRSESRVNGPVLRSFLTVRNPSTFTHLPRTRGLSYSLRTSAPVRPLKLFLSLRRTTCTHRSSLRLRSYTVSHTWSPPPSRTSNSLSRHTDLPSHLYPSLRLGVDPLPSTLGGLCRSPDGTPPSHLRRFSCPVDGGLPSPPRTPPPPHLQCRTTWDIRLVL